MALNFDKHYGKKANDPPRGFGYLGHYGYGLDKNYNKRVDEANKVIDQYNKKINTLSSFSAQEAFYESTLLKTNGLLKKQEFKTVISRSHKE
jgi:hypothetical protein